MSTTDAKPRPLWPFFAVLALTAFGLNWLWEMVQMPAHAEMAGRPWRDTLQLCTVATFKSWDRQTLNAALARAVQTGLLAETQEPVGGNPAACYRSR